MKRLKKYLQQHSHSTSPSSSQAEFVCEAFCPGVLSERDSYMNHWILFSEEKLKLLGFSPLSLSFFLVKLERRKKTHNSSADTTTPVERKLTTISKETFFTLVLVFFILVKNLLLSFGEFFFCVSFAVTKIKI
jgi:hypothetical protein